MHRVALVGYGLAGKAFHAPLIAAVPDLELALVISSRTAEVAADHPGTRVSADFSEALADPTIELLVLATPDHLHPSQALAALNADKHLVIDKPLAPTLAEARLIAARAAEKQLLLSVFHNRRWDSDFLTLQRLIADGRLGTIVEFESRFDRYRASAPTRWKDRRAAGVWQDLGPHLVDQALVLFGRPDAVMADFAMLKPDGAAVDYAHVLLRYPAHRVSLHITQNSPDHRFRMAAHGTRASFVKHGMDPQEDQSKAGMSPLDPSWGMDPRPGILTDADGSQSVVQSISGSYLTYYRTVTAALSGETPMPVSPDDALAVMDVIAAAVASNEQRREIALPA